MNTKVECDKSLAARRAILLVESPLSKRDVKRFGIRLLEESGINVEVWELAPLTLPNSEAQKIEMPTGVTIRRVRELDELAELCASLSERDVAIFLLGVYVNEMERCLSVIKCLSSSRARLGAIIGVSDWLNFHFSPAYSEEWPRTKFVYLKLKYCLANIYHRLGYALLTFPGTRSLTRRKYGIRSLDFIWAATSRKNINRIFVGRTTVTKYIHAFDFELVRELDRFPSLPTETIAYIDGLGPLHPDLQTLAPTIKSAPEDTYFSELRLAFDWIEDLTGMKVIVAAHPRAQPGILETLYGDRVVLYAATPTVIRDCRLVLLSYTSTSIALVVALRRPMIFLNSSTDSRYERILKSKVIKSLDIEAVLLQDLPKYLQIPTLSERSYNRFFLRHIKRSDSPDEPFWEVVSKDIKSLKN